MRGSSPAGLAGPSSHSHWGQGANDVLELAVAPKRVSSGHAAGRGREMWVGVLVPLPSFRRLCILSQVWRREGRFIRFALRSGDWERTEHETKPQTSSAWSLSSFKVACALPAADDLGLSHSAPSVSEQQSIPGTARTWAPSTPDSEICPSHSIASQACPCQVPEAFGVGVSQSSSALFSAHCLPSSPARTPRISLLAFSHHQV